MSRNKAKKKKPSYLLVIMLGAGFFGASIFLWLFLGSATDFDEKSRLVLIEENQTQKSAVVASFRNAGIIRFPNLLGLAGAPLNIWDKMKPGRYEIKKGQSLYSIVRMLKNGRLAEIKLVINKIRTRSDFAKLLSKQFLIDSLNSLQFMGSNDSLRNFQTDTSKLFTRIIPNTYTFYSDASLHTIFKKLSEESTEFWNEKNRLKKAAALNMSPEQIYILASIVEEETNFDSDKYKIASVYINRLKKSMPLQACPTIKYAMNNFMLTRIYEKYLTNPSPYNTYKVKGLPPGPICTPSPKTIDIVLAAPVTNYIYFVAKSDFSGYHHFSDNFATHNLLAKEYQQKLDEYWLKKQEKNLSR